MMKSQLEAKSDLGVVNIAHFPPFFLVRNQNYHTECT